MKLLVVGSMALDTIETPFGKEENILGGSASYFSLAASMFTDVGIVAVVGKYEGLTDVESVSVDTPWGSPSDDLVVGTLGDTKMVFLPRHGRGHKQMPSEINYRANIFAMKKMGVEWIVSVSAVGSMKEHISPGQIVIPFLLYLLLVEHSDLRFQLSLPL